MTTKQRLQIRAKTYRGKDGFVLSGATGRGTTVSIFTVRRETAEHIRDQVRANVEITLEDWSLDNA